MDEDAFRKIAEEEWAKIPDAYRERIDNVALLVEDAPSGEVRKQQGLPRGHTLLGLYHGIPRSERGAGYGTMPTLPDTITLYRLPVLHEARDLAEERTGETFPELVREVVRETIWHEVGHYFGLDEGRIGRREEEGTSRFKGI